MKVIGQRKDGYIVDISSNEIANLIGYYYYRAEECPSINVGDEINIHEMYEKLYNLKYKEKDIANIINNLKIMIDILTLNEPLIKNIIEG